MSIQIITTEDGSHTLLNEELDEPYHSIHGAIRESMHVFLHNGLDYWVKKSPLLEINVLEIGFGTGLNALLTLQSAIKSDIQIHYSSLEAYPIDDEIVHQLNYPELLPMSGSESLFQKLHAASWTKEEKVLDGFILAKQFVKLEDADLGEEKFNVVYFDAFAPNKQPEMWSISILQKIERSMKPGAVFVTYCAKGQLKRDLKSLGLILETLPGPPGKMEMVRASKL